MPKQRSPKATMAAIYGTDWPASYSAAGDTIESRHREYRTGIPMHVTSKRLGHSSLSVTADIYSHVFASQDREAAMAFEAHVARSSECDSNVIFRAATARIA
jgi:hypothetical protein